MISALVTGCVVGFLVAIPPGPLSVTTMVKSLEHGVGNALMLALGAVIIEFAYAGMGFFGVKLIHERGLETPVRLVSFLLVLTLGIRYTFFSTVIDLQTARGSQRNSFLLGLILSITTPSIGAAYLMIANIVQAHMLFNYSIVNNVVASIGAGVGCFSWLLLLSVGTVRMKQTYSSRAMNSIARGAGVLLLLVAVYFGRLILIAQL